MIQYRKTYLHLSEILPNLRKGSTKLKCPELFEVAFSSFFLLEKPFFDHSAHSSNSIQTFYANHYLREELGYSKLPDPEILLNYCLSKNFSLDLKFLCNFFNLNIVIDDIVCEEMHTNLLSPKKCLEEFILFCIDNPNNNNFIYDVSDLRHPSQDVYDGIEQNGYHIIDNFLNKKSLEQLKKATKMIADSEIKNNTGYFYGKNGINQRIYNLISKHKIYVDLVSHPYMIEMLDKVFDRPTLHEKFGLNSMTGHIVAPGASAIPMHIDSVVPDPIPPWMIRFIAILALDDFTKDNGATEFVPGSHKFLKRPTPEDVKKHKSVIAECKAGSLVLFDGAVWHRSSANKTRLPRMGLMLSYAASYFMELCGEEEHLTIVPKEIISSLSPKMKQMIGFHRAIKKGALDINKDIMNNDLSFKKLIL